MKTISSLSKYSIIVNDQNVQEAIDIANFLDDPRWIKLEKHFSAARELVLEEGKLGTLKEKDDLSKIRWAILEGFDRFLALPLEMKKALEEYLRLRREEEANDAKARNGVGSQDTDFQ